MNHPPSTPTPAESAQSRRLVSRLVTRLAYDYEALFTESEVAVLFEDSLERLLSKARVTTFVPTLADKLTRERLVARAQAEGKVAKHVPEVLFVCVQNAGRSQMAAALARHYAGPALHIRTGGSRPGEQIHPEVVQAMKEIGVSLDEEFPKPLTDEVLAAADVVVTMGCGDECPYVPGRRYEDWPIEDPATASVEGLIDIRHGVDVRVRGLLASLLPELTLPPRLTP